MSRNAVLSQTQVMRDKTEAAKKACSTGSRPVASNVVEPDGSSCAAPTHESAKQHSGLLMLFVKHRGSK
jgi:hypothetical protein